MVLLVWEHRSVQTPQHISLNPFFKRSNSSLKFWLPFKKPSFLWPTGQIYIYNADLIIPNLLLNNKVQDRVQLLCIQSHHSLNLCHFLLLLAFSMHQQSWFVCSSEHNVLPYAFFVHAHALTLVNSSFKVIKKKKSVPNYPIFFTQI